MSDSKEGPLSKISRLLGLGELAPIEALKRISERPVSVNPDVCFKMANRPEDMSDTGVHRLYGDELIRRAPKARQYDLRYDYASYRPKGQEWICVDLLTYDGAADSEAPCNLIGRGGSEKEARMDLLGQFWDYDNPDKPIQRPGIVVHSSPVEPPTYIDNPGFRDDDEDSAFDGGLSDLDDPR